MKEEDRAVWVAWIGLALGVSIVIAVIELDERVRQDRPFCVVRSDGVAQTVMAESARPEGGRFSGGNGCYALYNRRGHRPLIVCGGTIREGACSVK